eukprot:CAMPEP_0174233496 /NCGR_PEP_ID=MMETSP0417-20130205/3515_1 /TAXON_ID=242541 /ORGANISM="Mayorella sp, Strain BSH-02190019" /LENGTH=1125 /DNA_ID=CAMNT_0015311713 /DNA_START=50 /DNA_END=3423 /DNA_ORIENTATION=-
MSTSAHRLQHPRRLRTHPQSAFSSFSRSDPLEAKKNASSSTQNVLLTRGSHLLTQSIPSPRTLSVSPTHASPEDTCEDDEDEVSHSNPLSDGCSSETSTPTYDPLLSEKLRIGLGVGLNDSKEDEEDADEDEEDADEDEDSAAKRWSSESLLPCVTVDLVDCFRVCNPEYAYTRTRNPKRVLTHPSEGCSNHGHDNEEANYILYVNSIIVGPEKRRYKVLDILGQGTFGQVAKCLDLDSGRDVAIKVIKNKPAYFNQGLLEVQVLEMLRKYALGMDQRQEQPPGSDSPHSSWGDYFVRLDSYFVFRKHLCLTFELLDINLYELLKQNRYRGLSTNLVRMFVRQILRGLLILRRTRIVHCDLKPENILLVSLESPQIKLIDFGSACFEHHTIYTYVQSRFYRSPEVILGCQYTMSIDMWSVGCIAAELFLGLPLFPGSNEFNQLTRITSMLGMPPMHMLWSGKSTRKFFNVRRAQGTARNSFVSLKTEKQYARENNIAVQPNKKYFNYNRLDKLIRKYPLKPNLSPAQSAREMSSRAAFYHFLTGLLALDPEKRWTPEQALCHPFITGEPFHGGWPPVTVRFPVSPSPPRVARGSKVASRTAAVRQGATAAANRNPAAPAGRSLPLDSPIAAAAAAAAAAVSTRPLSERQPPSVETGPSASHSQPVSTPASVLASTSSASPSSSASSSSATSSVSASTYASASSLVSASASTSAHGVTSSIPILAAAAPAAGVVPAASIPPADQPWSAELFPGQSRWSSGSSSVAAASTGQDLAPGGSTAQAHSSATWFPPATTSLPSFQMRTPPPQAGSSSTATVPLLGVSIGVSPSAPSSFHQPQQLPKLSLSSYPSSGSAAGLSPSSSAGSFAQYGTSPNTHGPSYAYAAAMQRPTIAALPSPANLPVGRSRSKSFSTGLGASATQAQETVAPFLLDPSGACLVPSSAAVGPSSSSSSILQGATMPLLAGTGSSTALYPIHRTQPTDDQTQPSYRRARSRTSLSSASLSDPSGLGVPLPDSVAVTLDAPWDPAFGYLSAGEAAASSSGSWSPHSSPRQSSPSYLPQRISPFGISPSSAQQHPQLHAFGLSPTSASYLGQSVPHGVSARPFQQPPPPPPLYSAQPGANASQVSS